MTPVRPLAVAEGIYLAVGKVADFADAPCHPADLPIGRGLPAWRAAEHRASRALLRGLLARVADAGATTAPLTAGPNGKPSLADCPGVTISMSHTEGWVAAAAGVRGTGLGIDVQAPVQVSDALVRRCCLAGDLDQLGRLSPAARYLEVARIWSVQEACVKATGAGLGGSPWAIPVALGQRAGRWGAVRWQALSHPGSPPVAYAYCPKEAT